MTKRDLQQEFPWGRFHALDYPVRLDKLAGVLEEIHCSHSRDERLDPRPLSNPLIGNSANTRKVRELIEQVAPALATVLITGKSGTGKEVVARQIHELSDRAGPFIAVNCGAIPESLLESELFGHEKGAFTGAVSARAGRFEQAQGGTFFLDEIGDMPVGMQVKLLRVLEERVIDRVGGARSIPVDVRLIAATHRDLQRRIATGAFREDLYYRLSVFPIEIAPLAERPDDIPPLVDEFIRRIGVEQSRSIQFADDAMDALQDYAWPGNVRELANLIERLVVLKPSGVIGVQDLPWPIVERETVRAGLPEVTGHTLVPVGACDADTLPADGVDLKQHLSEVERGLIQQALVESKGVVQGAAEILGVGRTTLVEKIKRYGIDTSASQAVQKPPSE